MWLVKRKTRRRVSSSTPNNLFAEIASAGLSPQRSSYYVDKGFDAHTKGGTPGRLPLYMLRATNTLFMAFPDVHDVCYVKGR